MTNADTNIGTTPVRAGFAFDEAGLDRWMAAHIPAYAGPLTVEQFKGGQSNPTYKIATPRRNYVLRRKPPGAAVKGAHAMDREVRVLTALGAAGFPVAHVHGLCTDDSVIGTWFYLMEMVEGRIFWDGTIPSMSPTDRRAAYDVMNATIAQLHAVDVEKARLSDFGRSDQFVQRQIRRWTEQYLDDTLAGRDANMDRLIEWLPANLPESEETSLIHGDFRIDNIIFHPSEPRILAVLDWELATLGDPIADLTHHAMMYHMPPHIVAGLGGADLAALNIPSEHDYVAAYCARTGRQEIAQYNCYIAFNLFRLAAIFHGIKGRFLRGNATSAQAAERVRVFPELAALAWSSTRRSSMLIKR